MTKFKEEQLITVAEEIQEICGFAPPLEEEIKEEGASTIALIKEAAESLAPDDSLTKETVDILRELFIDSYEELDKKGIVDGKVPVLQIFQELGIVDKEPEKKFVNTEEQPEEAEEIPENKPKEQPEEIDDLFSEVESAEKLKDLRDIAKSYDEFKDIRGQLSRYKVKKELQKDMLAILREEPEETKSASIPEEKKNAELTAKKETEKEKIEQIRIEKSAPEITRQSAVFIAIREICKKPSSINEIAKKANSIYMKNNSKSKGISKLQNMSNVVRHSIFALIEFDILFEKDGKYLLR